MSRFPVQRTRAKWEAQRQVVAAIRACGIKWDGRAMPGINELERAERFLYGDLLTHLTAQERFRAVIVATRFRKLCSPDHPLNRARGYLRKGNKHFEAGEFQKARMYFASARAVQDHEVA